MPTNRETLLCRYHYDPLDRLVACTLLEQASTQRFYLKTRLATEIQGPVQHSIFQHDDQLLAQQQHQGGTVETTLLATDQQRSVLNTLDATQPHPFAYTPYGHRPPDGGVLSLLGFNGERPDPVTGHYVLGNGYRAFNPVLMRFNSPDSWSPFGEGGLNAYAYCVGDPVNRSDPTGHFSGWLIVRNNFSRIVNMGIAPKLTKSTPLSIVSMERKGAISAVARRNNTMGAFEPFENMPDVMGTIIGNLKAEDIAALGATSSKMFKTVDEAKLTVSRLLNSATLKNNNKAIQRAWDVATGEMPGTTPNQLRTANIDNPYAIPHVVDESGFASLEEIDRRFHLREKAMETQQKIRRRLD